MGEWEDREQDIKNMVDNENRIKQLIETGYKNFENKEVQDAFNKLRNILKPDSDVYSTLTHYTSSSTTRAFLLTIPICEDNKLEIWKLDYYIKTLLDIKIHKKGGNIKRGGDAEDIIYDLSWLLFNNGYLLHNQRINY